jgi:hypothetical protein
VRFVIRENARAAGGLHSFRADVIFHCYREAVERRLCGRRIEFGSTCERVLAFDGKERIERAVQPLCIIENAFYL